MIEPTLALQTAIRNRLAGSPNIAALVDPENIRAGSSRPDDTPCIIMSNASTSLHGHDYRAQRCAWASFDLHIWAMDREAEVNGEDIVKEIAFAITQALDKHSLQIDGGYVDHCRVTHSAFPRDPQPTFGHGILSVEALIRWIV